MPLFKFGDLLKINNLSEELGDVPPLQEPVDVKLM